MRVKIKSYSGIQIPVLMYHQIGAMPAKTLYPGKYVTEAVFDQHLRILKRFGKKLVSIEEAEIAARSKSGMNLVVMTFDDGYKSFSELVVPKLVEFGGKGTVFIVTDQVGKTNKWDTDLGDAPENLLTWDELRSVQKLGFTVGAHTKTHCHLDQLDPEIARDEILGSREKIESELSSKCDLFCYPYGGQSLSVRQAVQNSGFRYGFATTKGGYSPEKDPFSIPRVTIRCDTNGAVFLYKLWRVYAFDR